MALHNEIEFENDICDQLAAHGWLYAENDAASYDRQIALFPADVLDWMKLTDPDAWDTISKNHRAAAEATLLKRLRDSLNHSGTLHVIRNGFDVLGLRKPLRMAQFKPALAMNPDIMQRYAANRLRVVRQVRYSQHNENSIDLVLFLNGIPVATIEIKTDNTQSIDDAVYQYKKDRNPQPKGQTAEPLLTFQSGALVHFAVSSSHVKMTTKLAGLATDFLPFDLGNNRAAGNPLNPTGYRTSYLWERVWERDGWLEIVGRYIVAEKNEKKQVTKLIFPRYHQLDATHKLQQAVLAEALSGDKKIVVCTIQTFPFALKAVRELAATQGKRFAVIADEAHSSQTGEAATKLKMVLSAEEQQDLDEGETISSEDILAAQMTSRAADAGVTYRRTCGHTRFCRRSSTMATPTLRSGRSSSSIWSAF